MKTKLPVVIVSLLTFTMSSYAQEQDEFKPSGKPFVKVFSNFHSDLDGNNNSAFELNRAYFGYSYKMSEEFSGKVTFDVGDPSNGSKLEHTAYVKVASVLYKKNNLSVDFGLIGLRQFKLQEKYWGHRYIEKSFMDLNKFGHSADLGVSAEYKFNDILSLDGTVRNGEGYKLKQSDGNYRTELGVTTDITENFVFRGGYSIHTKAINEEYLSGFLGYKNDELTVGAEYNYNFQSGFVKYQERSGFSGYGSYNINEKFQLFARYDQLTSNTLAGEEDPWNISKNGDLIIGGVQFKPVKYVKTALNYQGFMPSQSGTSSSNYIFLNLEYAFK